MTLTALQFALRLSSAVSLGALVGLERQWRQRMAGTRTNALVAAGACAFVQAGYLLNGDPSGSGRIVSYVVSGVGFLGAGVIFKDGANVRGLNTAATIWCSAGMGVLTGLGAGHLALILAAAILLTNTVLRPLAYRFNPVLPPAEPIETTYEIDITTKFGNETLLRSLLLASIRSDLATLQSVYSEESESGQVHIKAEVTTVGRRNDVVEHLVMRLAVEENVASVRWATAKNLME